MDNARVMSNIKCEKRSRFRVIGDACWKRVPEKYTMILNKLQCWRAMIAKKMSLLFR
jgi:hypothetical protein